MSLDSLSFSTDSFDDDSFDLKQRQLNPAPTNSNYKQSTTIYVSKKADKISVIPK